MFFDDADRGAACAEALVLADLLGHELRLPVFLYGILAEGRDARRGPPRRTAGACSSGSSAASWSQTSVRRALHPTAGAVLVGARPPLIAFNVELQPPATIDDAKRIAAAIREGGPEGLIGVRAIGLWLAPSRRRAGLDQRRRPSRNPLKDLIDAIAKHAEPIEAELVGLAPRAAFEGFPDDLPVRNKRLIEDMLSPREPAGV